MYYGYTDIADPILFIDVNGVPTASGYVVQRLGLSVRYIYPRVVNGNIYITSISQVYGTDLPAVTLSITVRIAT